MSQSSSNQRYQCVAFDAVGTLIHAQPSVVEAYSIIGNQHGANVHLDDVKRRFGTAFSSRQLKLTTSEAEELAFWKSIVSEVIGDVHDPDACFQELYNHFAKPESWRVDSYAASVIQGLIRYGIKIAIASNFDHRLHSVMDGHSELKQVSRRCISSEIGWRKPSLEFYYHLVTIAGCRAEEILMVGDDLENDVLGALESGLDAVHLTSQNESHSQVRQIQTLNDVLRLVITANNE
jgi:putative hydrolase of the HAD superfamily